jgi:hypothetical protein
VPSAAQALQPPDEIPVIDLDAEEVTCPACQFTFATGPRECPDCGLFIG